MFCAYEVQLRFNIRPWKKVTYTCAGTKNNLASFSFSRRAFTIHNLTHIRPINFLLHMRTKHNSCDEKVTLFLVKYFNRIIKK